MKPNKLLLVLAATAAAVAAFTLPASSEAGSYRSRIEGTCAYCRGPVYSYYKPIGYSHHGRASYGWVTSHHSSCRNSYRRHYTRVQPRATLRYGSSSASRFFAGVRTFGSPYYGLNSHRYRSFGWGGYCH